MMRLILSAGLALACSLFLAGGARAHTYGFTCTGAAGELQLRLNGTSAWSSTDGGAGTTAKPVAGDTIRINSTTFSVFCTGDIFVNTSGLTFRNHTGSEALINTDDIDGMFEVAGAQITIDGIELLCTTCSPATANTTGLSNFTENGSLVLHDGAVALLENAKVAGGQTSGIFATRNAAISIVGSSIVGNGQGGGAGQFVSGVFAAEGSSVRLGNPDGSGSVTIAGNGPLAGGCPGFGILMAESSSLEAFAATIGGVGISNNGASQNSCGQILLQSGSTARIESTTITDTTAPAPAVQALGGSSFVTTLNTNNSVGFDIAAGNNGAVLLGAASSAVLDAATITSTGTSVPTVEAAGSSVVTLAGGNVITNSTTGGIVFQIDHSSSLIQVPASQFGFEVVANDAISGSAFVQVQSSMDIGIGLLSGVPSIPWTVGSGNCILIQQNSSFRMSGGVEIDGVAPSACTLNGGAVSTTIVFQQQSNGFFNLSRGGTDAILGGGGVSCVFAGMPNAHVTDKANITPAGAQPVIIGSWTQAGSATSPGCLGP